MADGISKLTWGLYVPAYCRSVQRADARARVRASPRCIVHNKKTVAMLACRPKGAFSGGRWDSRGNIWPQRTRLLPQRATRRRARAHASSRCVVHHRKVAMLAWELKCALSGDRCDFQVNMRPLRARRLSRRTTRRRARCIVYSRWSQCWPGNCSAPLGVIDGISRLAWGLYVPVCCCSVQRAEARACCIVHNRTVAMFAWKLKRTLSGDR